MDSEKRTRTWVAPASGLAERRFQAIGLPQPSVYPEQMGFEMA